MSGDYPWQPRRTVAAGDEPAADELAARRDQAAPSGTRAPAPPPNEPDAQQRHIDAELRVKRALELIEAAQHQLEKAAQELSPVEGGAVDWRRVSDLAHRAHQQWRRLAYRNRSRWKMALYFYMR